MRRPNLLDIKIIDDRGRLVVADWGNHRLQILDTDGRMIDVIGASLYTRPARGQP